MTNILNPLIEGVKGQGKKAMKWDDSDDDHSSAFVTW